MYILGEKYRKGEVEWAVSVDVGTLKALAQKKQTLFYNSYGWGMDRPKGMVETLTWVGDGSGQFFEALSCTGRKYGFSFTIRPILYVGVDIEAALTDWMNPERMKP